MSTSFWFNYVLALAVVGLMLAGLYVMVRSVARGRILASANRRLVAVLESTALTQHTTLHVVKVAGRYLLIGGGNAQVATLAELPADEVEPWLNEQRSALGLQRATLIDAFKRLRGKP